MTWLIPNLPLSELLLLFMAGLLCCVLHEFAHASFALAVGGRITRIGFAPKMLALYVQRPRLSSTAQEIACALCGPTVHLLLALLLFSDTPLVHALGGVNLWLGCWNLVMPKSDGRRAWAEVRRA